MKSVTVGEFLKRFENPFEAVTVEETATLQEAMEMLLRHHEERSLFVLDEAKHVTGVISVGTLARHLLHEEVAPPSGFSPSTTILTYLTAERAKDIMTREVVCCTMDDTIESVAKKMLGKPLYKMLPVVDEAMHLIDVISIISILEFGVKNDNES
jgi:CBS domain-containing protein